jgi:pimeloyl-ACP methyl ester carboxylesterase
VNHAPTDPETYARTDFEAERGLTASEFWLGTVQAHACDRKSPLEVTEAHGNANVVFECDPQRCDEKRPVVAILRRYARANAKIDEPKAKPPVLFVHGATAWRATFFEPDGGIVDYLQEEFDVWTLDWRASKLITQPWEARKGEEVPCALRNATLDDVIDGELRAAVRTIGEVTKQAPSVVGHCIGAAVTAAAIARGKLRFNSDAGGAAAIGRHVVLSAIGLFYRGSVDTWLRAQERLDLKTTNTWRLRFDDATDWPEAYQTVFNLWERTPYPHCDIAFCRRISSLFGSPYRPNDIGNIHRQDGKLEEQFGVVPISILNHCARNVRRGWSGTVGASETEMADLENPEFFRDLKVTLITGNENQLWHRDSIDRMAEWLRRHNRYDTTQKKVFQNYGHQDLWWSASSAQPGGVYEYVLSALRR